jgi:NAD(P)-dependent dehydrogenase (short-subunit alcohol dehydrogenase family)
MNTAAMSTTGKEIRRIVMTGGSSGIGQAIARRLSSPSSRIANLDLLDGEATRKLCSGPLQTIHTDLAESDAIAAAFTDVDTLFDGRAPDILICCASLSRATPFLDVHLDELDLLLRVNIRGTFLACQQAARRMQSARRGRIVIITSICALQGWAKESVYCLTKAAQQSMVQSLAVELAPFGILVNGIAPGLIEKTGDAMAKTRADPEIHRHDMERTSLGRFGMVEEVAEAVDYLTTVTWTTGQTMVLDGGFMATGLGYFGANRDQVVQRDPGTQSKGVQHED